MIFERGFLSRFFSCFWSTGKCSTTKKSEPKFGPVGPRRGSQSSPKGLHFPKNYVVCKLFHYNFQCVLLSMRVTSLGSEAPHYGSEAFKSTHGGRRNHSLARSLRSAPFRCAPFHSALFRSTPLHSIARRFTCGLVREWESGDVLTRPHASICADSTHSEPPSSTVPD